MSPGVFTDPKNGLRVKEGLEKNDYQFPILETLKHFGWSLTESGSAIWFIGNSTLDGATERGPFHGQNRILDRKLYIVRIVLLQKDI